VLLSGSDAASTRLILVLVFPSRSAPGSFVFWSGVCPAVWPCCLRELLTAGSVLPLLTAGSVFPLLTAGSDLPRLIALSACLARGSAERRADRLRPFFFSSGSSHSHRSAHRDLFSAWQSIHGFGFDVEFL
jgi:hypothetical protein